MKTRPLVTAALIACLCCLGVGLRSAEAEAGPVGEWKTQDGAAKVAIKPCGDNLCGYVSWTKDASAFVGRQVLLNLKQNGAIWSGTAINVASGQKYAARISLQDEATLKIEGCVMGAMICGGQHWSRVK